MSASQKAESPMPNRWDETTHWTVIQPGADNESPQADVVMDELYQRVFGTNVMHPVRCRILIARFLLASQKT